MKSFTEEFGDATVGVLKEFGDKIKGAGTDEALVYAVTGVMTMLAIVAQAVALCAQSIKESR